MPITWYTSNSPGETLKLTHPSAGEYSAFLPRSLPPKLSLSTDFVRQLSEANHKLGRLSELGSQLPNPDLLVYAFMRREAVLSSRIEGIHTTVAEVYQFEADQVDRGQGFAREAYNNFEALRYGIEQIRHREITLGLVRELHQHLMNEVRDARGRDKNPGAIRTTQNYIGRHGTPLAQAIYVPPPPDRLDTLLRDWELFLSTNVELPILVKIALAHYQFEAIHPFEDGNGRVGRLLISLSMQKDGLLEVPLLSLSGYFVEHRKDYASQLLGITRDGAWLEWLVYFLRGVQDAAEDAIRRSQEILALHKEYQSKVQQQTRSKAIDLVDFIFKSPVFTPTQASQSVGVTVQAIGGHLRLLEQLEIIQETTGNYNYRSYRVPELLRLLEE